MRRNANILVELDKSTIKAIKAAAKEIKVTPSHLVYGLLQSGLVRLDRTCKGRVRCIDRVGNPLDSGRQWSVDLLRKKANEIDDNLAEIPF